MIETRRLKNVIILIEAILSFVLSGKIIVKIVLAYFLKKGLHVSQKKKRFSIKEANITVNFCHKYFFPGLYLLLELLEFLENY